MIHPTTDCVYSGLKGSYNEDDKYDVSDVYGMSKAMGEPSNCTVIRTSIIGEELENKKSFLEFVRNSDSEINGWDDHYWNGITCYQYCKIIDKKFWGTVGCVDSLTVKSSAGAHDNKFKVSWAVSI
jgi:dTDP-4-dehydrorhamnose reductase